MKESLTWRVAKKCWSPSRRVSFCFGAFSGLPIKSDLGVGRIEYKMSPDFFRFWSKCDVDGGPKRSSSSTLSAHLVSAINHILGHGVIVISFLQHGNDLGEHFLECNTKFYRYCWSLKRDSILVSQRVTKIRVQINKDAHWVKACRQLTWVSLPTLNPVPPFPLHANWLVSAAREFSTYFSTLREAFLSNWFSLSQLFYFSVEFLNE